MPVSAIAQRRIDRSLGLLQRRDHRLLWAYGLFSLLLVVVAEWAALHFHMADHFGSGVILLRAGAYVLLTMLLWGTILRADRRQVEQLLRREQNHFEATLLAYDGALTLKDTYTSGHGRRVGAYAATIAAAMGLDEAQVERVYQSGLLHDIGKIGTPDHILTKANRLTPEEYARIQHHPDAGADILAHIPALRPLVPGVRHHHERFSGCGYPQRLAGEAIPMDARIIAVADTLDAMTSNRSYSAALTWQRALDELREGAGSYFDPHVIEATLSNPCRSQLERLREQEMDA